MKIAPDKIRSRSSLDFEMPSAYESNGKQEKARLHKISMLPKLPTDSGSEFKKCALCETNVAISRHHLVPRSMSYARPSSRFKTVRLCKDCHTDVHWFFTNQELAFEFWEIPKLRAELEDRRKKYELKMRGTE